MKILNEICQKLYDGHSLSEIVEDKEYEKHIKSLLKEQARKESSQSDNTIEADTPSEYQQMTFDDLKGVIL